MKLTVKAYRGADNAEIILADDKITLIAGENGQGKSSIIEAAQAVLAARPLPTGMTKGFGRAVIHEAHQEASVRFDSRDGVRKLTYPDCQIHTLEGTGLLCDDWSLGLLKLTRLPIDERARRLTEIASCVVTRERLLAELSPLAMDAVQLERLVALALSKNFEAANKQAEGWARELKGEFKAVTGIQWGSNQGVTFTPSGWEDSLARYTLKELEEDAKDKQKNLEAAIGAAALTQQAKEHFGKRDEYAKEVERWAREVEQLTIQLKSAREESDTHQRRSQKLTCGGCGLVGIVENGILTKAPEKPVSQPKSQVKEIELKLGNAQATLGIAKNNFDKAVGCEGSLKQAPDVESFRQAAERAQQRVRAKVAKDQGTHLHHRIVDMLKAAEIVSPAGLPLKALHEALESLNQHLSWLCRAAGWAQVEITRDLDLLYNRRPYWLLSKSEKYRADATVQLVLARILRQEMVIFDEADMLDRTGRNQLFAALSTIKISALVAMTTFRAKDGSMEVPDLKRAGLGITYIVDSGMASPLSERVAV